MTNLRVPPQAQKKWKLYISQTIQLLPQYMKICKKIYFVHFTITLKKQGTCIITSTMGESRGFSHMRIWKRGRKWCIKCLGLNQFVTIAWFYYLFNALSFLSHPDSRSQFSQGCTQLQTMHPFMAIQYHKVCKTVVAGQDNRERTVHIHKSFKPSLNGTMLRK